MTQSPPPPLQLDYDSAETDRIGRRPRWVWAIVITYCLFAGAIVLLPVWPLIFDREPGMIVSASATASVLTLCGLALVMTPVQARRRRPLTRTTVWIPIIAAGLLIVGLLLGATFALFELFAGEDANFPKGVFYGAGAVWLGWALVLWLITARQDPNVFASKLHRWLIGGSVAELLVAVPSHLICRKRSDCCAGMMTGTAICIGVAVMFVALGPSVMMLYYRRWREIRNPKSQIRNNFK
jgi:hypothetical protein